MNDVTLIGKIQMVRIQDRGNWVTCGILIKNDAGLDTWFDVKGVNKTGKEMEWLPKLEGQHCLVAGRFTSYQNKTGDTVYGVSASKSGLQRLTEEDAKTLLDLGWGGVSKISGKVEGSKANDQGEHFLKVGIRYVKPKDNDFGTYFVRVRCPKDFNAEKYGEGSYVSVFGNFERGPDKKPMVKALCVG